MTSFEQRFTHEDLQLHRRRKLRRALALAAASLGVALLGSIGVVLLHPAGILLLFAAPGIALSGDMALRARRELARSCDLVVVIEGKRLSTRRQHSQLPGYRTGVSVNELSELYVHGGQTSSDHVRLLVAATNTLPYPPQELELPLRSAWREPLLTQLRIIAVQPLVERPSALPQIARVVGSIGAILELMFCGLAFVTIFVLASGGFAEVPELTALLMTVLVLCPFLVMLHRLAQASRSSRH